jgi:hypothetical protein
MRDEVNALDGVLHRPPPQATNRFIGMRRCATK